MKITKRQLKKLIKEEKARLLEMNAGYTSIRRPEPPAEVKRMSKDEAHTKLVETILELEEILGEAGVRAALSEMGYQ